MVNRVGRSLIIALAMTIAAAVAAYAQVPARPNPPRLVNDLAGVFTAEQVRTLEDTLVAFSKRTSNQIVVVTMSDFGGLDRAEMATRIGQEWGVGKADNDNGVVLLLKPKSATANGEIFIAPGKGLEGALPDITCSRIIRNTIIPRFREGDYYGGVWAGLKVIMPVAAGEYSYAEEDDDDGNVWLALLIVLCMFGLFVYLASKIDDHNGGSGGITRPGGPIIFGGSPWSGSSSSSGGSFGGGGFGGFGGGSFGGGGAGGSW